MQFYRHPFWAQIRRRPHAAPLLMLAAAILILQGVGVAQFFISPTTSAQTETIALQTTPEAHSLSESDTALYRNIFNLQKAHHWAEADAQIAQLENPVFLGVLQARRYLSSSYEPTAEELGNWVYHFAHFPEYADIAKRYSREYPHIFAGAGASTKVAPHTNLTAITKRRAFSHHHRSRQLSAGLRAWKNQHYKTAAKHFKQTARQMDRRKDVSEFSRLYVGEEKAAAYFWAYRAERQLGNNSSAFAYLEKAAKHPHTLYGFLAGSLLLKGTAEALQPDAFPKLAKDYQHVAMLNLVGQTHEAEQMLSKAYAQAHAQNDAKKQAYLLTLAEKMDLPITQIAMAGRWWTHARHSKRGYPIPKWAASLSPRTDKALVLAIVHQESNFNPRAGSHKGAQGLMQILPSTAQYLIKRKRALEYKTASNGGFSSRAFPSYNLKDPRFNLRIGQAYLRYLSSIGYIGKNIPLIAASYNAGPGSVKNWQKRGLTANTDPLLYMESIPFKETRSYVKNVLRNYFVYDLLLNDSLDAAHQMAAGELPKASL